MSDTEQVQEQEEVAPKKRGKLPMVAALLGVMLGSGIGAIVLGPTVAPLFAGGGGGHGEEVDDHGAPPEPSVHVIDNLVVNPAGSQGMRLLLTSIAIDVGGTPALVDRLQSIELDLRGRFLHVFGSRTVTELSDITQRDTITAELKVITEEVLGESVDRVFLPQFVLQ